MQTDWGQERHVVGQDRITTGVFIHGNGFPHNGIGNPGSWYLDHDSFHMIGPKTPNNEWPTIPAWVVESGIIDNLLFFGTCPPECEYGYAGMYYVLVSVMPPRAYGPHDGSCYTELGQSPLVCVDMPTHITEQGLTGGNTPTAINPLRRLNEQGLVETGSLIPFSSENNSSTVCYHAQGVGPNTGSILPGAPFVIAPDAPTPLSVT